MIIWSDLSMKRLFSNSDRFFFSLLRLNKFSNKQQVKNTDKTPTRKNQIEENSDNTVWSQQVLDWLLIYLYMDLSKNSLTYNNENPYLTWETPKTCLFPLLKFYYVLKTEISMWLNSFNLLCNCLFINSLWQQIHHKQSIGCHIFV